MIGVVFLVGSWDFNFLGFHMNYNKETKSFTFWRGSEVSPEWIALLGQNECLHETASSVSLPAVLNFRAFRVLGFAASWKRLELQLP